MGMEPKGKGKIKLPRELLRTCLLGTRVNKSKSEGWAIGKPTSTSGKEKELLRRWTHPTDTLASNDESTMNVLGERGKVVLLRTHHGGASCWNGSGEQCY
jgi:hypothetical protein